MMHQNPLPLARCEGLVIEQLQDEVLVYDMDRQKSHCLNRTAAFIWSRCDGRTDVTQMVRALRKEMKSSVTEQAVWLGLKQLAGAHLLQGRLAAPAGLRGLTRRELMRRAGLAAAVTLPLILTIAAPTAKAQASCLPRDSACTTNSQCCSGNCRGNGLCA